MPITALPPRPIPGAETFEADAGTLLDALPLFGTELDALQADVLARSAAISATAAQAQTSATSTAASEAAALASANAAALSAGAALWVSGTTYALNARAISPATRYAYRRTVAGAGTTDPSADTTNWRADALEVQSGRPTVRPTLLLPLRRSRTLDQRVVFTRSTTRQTVGPFGVLQAALANEWAMEHNPATLRPIGRPVWAQATNLALHSRAFNNAAWVKSNMTITADALAGLDDTISADKLVETTSSAEHRVRQVVTTTAGVVYTHSVRLRAGERHRCALQIRSASEGGAFVSLDLAAGTVVGSGTFGAGVSILGQGIRPLRDGWHLAWVTAVSAASASLQPAIVIQNSTGLSAYAGDGVSGLFAWESLMQEGWMPMEPIPTTTAQVTRAADVPSISLAGLIRQGEGSLYAEFRRPYAVTEGAAPRVITLHDGSANNRITLQLSLSGTASQIAVVMVAAGVETVSSTPATIAVNNLVRVALAWRANDVALAVNGALVWSTSPAVIPVGLTTAALGTDSAGANPLNGELGACSLYPVRLASNELQALTVA